MDRPEPNFADGLRNANGAGSSFMSGLKYTQNRKTYKEQQEKLSKS
jgi:hypothetical protein